MEGFTWLPSTRIAFQDAMDLLPSVSVRRGYILVGEAQDHNGKGGRARFIVMRERGLVYSRGSRPITRREFDSLVAGDSAP